MSSRFRDMVSDAYRMIPLYVRHGEKTDVQTLMEEDRWSGIPLLERNEIIENNTAMMMPWAMPLMLQERLMYARTSGSTGKYMEIYWTREDYQKSMLPLWYYRYKYYQITPKDRVCYFYTINNPEQETESVRRNAQFGFSKMNLDMGRLSEIYREMLEFQPVWLMLQPSMAKLLCGVWTDMIYQNFRR